MSFAETLTLIEMCRWELDCLHNVLAAFNAFGEAGNKLTAAHFRTEIRRDEALLRRTGIRILLERAEEARAFAQEARDPEVKRLLLQLAGSYEGIAEARAANAKAEDRVCA